MVNQRNKDKGKAKSPAIQQTVFKKVQSPQVVSPRREDDKKVERKKARRPLRELDDRIEFTLFGADIPDFDYESASLIKRSQRMNNFFTVGGILQNTSSRNRHDYTLLEKLGPTEFKVSETVTGKVCFLKVEASKMPWHGPKLKWFVDILRTSQKLEPIFRTHFLELMDSGLVSGSYNFIVTKIGGISLMDLRSIGPPLGIGHPDQQFLPETALRLCLQTLQAIHDIHLCHFVHRNIHPKNFLVGLGSKSTVVYIVGFSLAEQYYPKIKPQKYDPNWKPYFGRLTKFSWIDLTFQSRAYHRGDKIHRQHDMESWIYMCYYLFNCYCLPWKWWDQALRLERQIYNFKNLFFAGGFDEKVEVYAHPLLHVIRHMVDQECSPKPIDYSSYGDALIRIESDLGRTCDWSGPFHFMAPRNKQASPSGVPKEGRTVTAHPQSPINLPKAGPTISRSPVVETPNELRISAEYTGSKENVQNTDDSQGFASSKTSHKPPEKSCYRLPSNDQGSKNKGQNRRMGEDQEDSSGSSSTDTNTRKGSKSVERENFMSCEAMNAVKDPRHKK